MSTFGTYQLSGKTIKGTSNKVTEYAEFSSDESEQEGYYLAIEVKPWKGSQIRSGRKPESWKILQDDGNCVIYLGHDAPDQTPWYEIKESDGAITRYTVSVTAAMPVRTKKSITRKPTE